MLEPRAEAAEFAAEVRRLLASSWPMAETRRVAESGQEYDPASWKALASLGVAGLLIPEELGGTGAGIDTTVLVAAELGRVLLPGPFWGSAVASAELLRRLDTTVARELLAEIADGSIVASAALLGSGLGVHGSAVAAQREMGGGWRLCGISPWVTDGRSAELVLVPARVGDGMGVFVVRPGVRGLTVRPLACLDLTRPLTRLEYADAPADLVALGPEVAGVLDRVSALAAVVALAEGVGAAERCLELATDYARTRVQFGRVIGSFQAIKQRCADMFIRVESVRSTVYRAAAVLAHEDSSSPEIALATDTALAYGAPWLLRCAGDAIQVHGGIGFTWEHDAHLFFKRAEADVQLMGDVAARRARIAARLEVVRDEDPPTGSAGQVCPAP